MLTSQTATICKTRGTLERALRTSATQEARQGHGRLLEDVWHRGSDRSFRRAAGRAEIGSSTVGWDVGLTRTGTRIDVHLSVALIRSENASLAVSLPQDQSKEEIVVPIKTSVEDIQKLLGYLGKQIGWVDQPKVEKALGPLDDRKVGAMVEFGLLLRDGGNLRATDLGQQFNADQNAALGKVLGTVELYRATLEWVHYGKRSEATAAEIGQYWESSHADTLGGLKGSTLKDGAVCFGRVVDGAGLGTFTLGRAGKETRVAFDLARVDVLVDGGPSPADEDNSDGSAGGRTSAGQSTSPVVAEALEKQAATEAQSLPPAAVITPTVAVSTSPSVHVNVEIHIAADATADTVREIFKNMARYVLDRPVTDDGE